MRRSALILLALAAAGCGRAPTPETKAGPPDSGKSGRAFTTRWTWTSTGPASAKVTATVTPTTAARSLELRARLPEGVSFAGGEPSRTIPSPAPGAAATLAFDIAFPAGAAPLVAVDVLLIVSDDDRSAATLALHDPSIPRPTPVPKSQENRTDAAGFPARVGGELEPAKRK